MHHRLAASVGSPGATEPRRRPSERDHRRASQVDRSRAARRASASLRSGSASFERLREPRPRLACFRPRASPSSGHSGAWAPRYWARCPGLDRAADRLRAGPVDRQGSTAGPVPPAALPEANRGRSRVLAQRMRALPRGAAAQPEAGRRPASPEVVTPSEESRGQPGPDQRVIQPRRPKPAGRPDPESARGMSRAVRCRVLQGTELPRTKRPDRGCRPDWGRGARGPWRRADPPVPFQRPGRASFSRALKRPEQVQESRLGCLQASPGPFGFPR